MDESADDVGFASGGAEEEGFVIKSIHPCSGFTRLDGFLGQFDRISVRFLVRLFIVFSAVIGFLFFCDMHSYLPWKLRVLKAMGRTIELHFVLWLATIEMRSRWRFLIALLVIPSWAVVYLLFWNRSPVTLMAGLTLLIWLLHGVLRGKRLETQSI